MTKPRLWGLGLAAVLAAGSLTPAAAQVRGYSAIDLQPSTRVDVNVRVETNGVPAGRYQSRSAYDDGYYDDRRDPYDDETYDPYYDEPYLEGGYRDAPPPRRGEVYYPRENTGGEVIAGVLVGAILGYAIAEAGDDHHHYHRTRYVRVDRYHGRRGHRHDRYCRH